MNFIAGWVIAAPQPSPKADSQPAPVREHDLQDVRCECCGYMTYHREHMGCIRAARAPADSVLEDAARLEFEMQHGSAIAAARKQGANHG